MSKSYRYDSDYQMMPDHHDSDLNSRDGERSRQRLAVRRDIEDYFERKQLKQIDEDWYDD